MALKVETSLEDLGVGVEVKEEETALVQLKHSMQSVLTLKTEMDDVTLLRFLKARNYNVKKAEEMILASFEWRRQWEIDSLRDWEPPSEITKGFDIYHCGFDHEGRPVYYGPLGSWISAKDLYAKGEDENCLKFAAKTMDRVYTELLTTKRQSFIAIVDVTGATYRKALHEARNFKGMQDLIWLFRDYEANYPETLHKAFIINTPTVFYWGFNLVKPVMSRRTLGKIRIYENCNEGWKSDLRGIIPENAVPERLGGEGKMTCLY